MTKEKDDVPWHSLVDFCWRVSKLIRLHKLQPTIYNIYINLETIRSFLKSLQTCSWHVNNVLFLRETDSKPENIKMNLTNILIPYHDCFGGERYWWYFTFSPVAMAVRWRRYQRMWPLYYYLSWPDLAVLEAAVVFMYVPAWYAYPCTGGLGSPSNGGDIHECHWHTVTCPWRTLLSWYRGPSPWMWPVCCYLILQGGRGPACGGGPGSGGGIHECDWCPVMSCYLILGGGGGSGCGGGPDGGGGVPGDRELGADLTQLHVVEEAALYRHGGVSTVASIPCYII